MLKWLNAKIYGIEQRIEKWGRLRNAYYAGKKAYSKHDVGYHCNPHHVGSDEYYQWSAGWFKAAMEKAK